MKSAVGSQRGKTNPEQQTGRMVRETRRLIHFVLNDIQICGPQHDFLSADCIGGQTTVPYEQNTQQ
jgi:hypothetical protein